MRGDSVESSERVSILISLSPLDDSFGTDDSIKSALSAVLIVVVVVVVVDEIRGCLGQ